MIRSGHVDTFARDNLPPQAQWPEFKFTLPELQYPDRLNCVTEYVDKWVAGGEGARTATSPTRTSPAVGVIKPPMMLRSVLLPHPDGPSRQRNSPRAMSSDRSSIASTACGEPTSP